MRVDSHSARRSAWPPRPAIYGRTSNGVCLRDPYVSSPLHPPGEALHYIAWPVDDFVNDAIFFGLMSDHDEIALNIAFDPVEALAGVLGDQRIGNFANAQNLTGMNIDVRGLPTQSTHGGLVDEDTRVGQSKPLALGARKQKKCSHAGRLPDAIRHHVVLDELHRIVNGQAGGNRPARGVDIKLDVFFWVFAGEKQHLGNDEVGNLVIDGRSKKDDVIAKQTGIDIVGALAATRLLDHHGD